MNGMAFHLLVTAVVMAAIYGIVAFIVWDTHWFMTVDEWYSSSRAGLILLSIMFTVICNAVAAAVRHDPE